MNATSSPPAAGGKAAAGRTRPAVRSARRRAREFALQGLYQWLVSRAEPAAVAAHIRELESFGKCDSEHFDALLQGAIAQAAALDAVLARHIDRRIELLSPVEHAVLLIGAYELQHCVDIPYRVCINEAVEIAKSFGGTDGHKYVNGVLDKAAADLRPGEVPTTRHAGPRQPPH